MNENNNITIDLVTYSWISGLLGEESSLGNIVKQEVKSPTTLGGFFAGLAEKYPEFRKYVLDPSTGVMNDEVVIILNNKLVQYSDAKDTPLSDQDTITLSPVLVGG